MRKSVALTLVLIVALVVTVTQGWMALRVPGFSSDDAYMHLRQAENIQKTGVPLSNDALSPTGKRLLVTPLYDYVLALVGLQIGTETALKVVPALCIGVLIILVFFLTFQLTQEGLSAFFAAAAVACMPALFGSSINTASTIPFILVLTTLLLWQLLTMSSRTEPFAYVALIIVLSFAHPSVVLVLIGLLFYWGLLMIEEFKADKGFGELLLFSTLFVIWSLTVRFKDALTSFGPAVVFQNIPPLLRQVYFPQVQMLDAVGIVGVVPFLLGGYMVYTFIFTERRRDVYLLLGFALAMGFLLWLDVVEPLLGIIFLGLVLSILFGIWIKETGEYLTHTRAAHWRVPLLVIVFIILAVSSLGPAIRLAQVTINQAPSQEELDALKTVAARLPQDAVIVALPDEGYRIEALTHRRVVQDLEFILQKDAAQRYQDINDIFTSPSKVDAVGLLNKYGATYIYMSKAAQAKFKIPQYLSDQSCFPNVFDGVVKVYQSVCKVEQQ